MHIPENLGSSIKSDPANMPTHDRKEFQFDAQIEMRSKVNT